jgi:hypothetical protein
VPTTVKELVAKAMEEEPDAFNNYRPSYPEFRDALLAVGAHKSGAMDNNRLARWLRDHAGEIIDEVRIVPAGESHHVQRWRCEPVSEPTGEATIA